ncbi:hypothetical protein OH687_31165 [Burkholderia anthina]|nr:hypothetical protein OH687_31165 [Burkholderia anthina]
MGLGKASAIRIRGMRFLNDKYLKSVTSLGGNAISNKIEHSKAE